MIGENWDRFLPKFKQVKINRKKKTIKEKKVYTPFPPEQTLREEDKKMETGEYFLSEQDKKDKIMDLKKQKQERKRL